MITDNEYEEAKKRIRFLHSYYKGYAINWDYYDETKRLICLLNSYEKHSDFYFSIWYDKFNKKPICFSLIPSKFVYCNTKYWVKQYSEVKNQECWD